ncbi:hypothetical protein [Mesorhizobium australicum]|uniref:Spore coat protein U (SCPU) domain-containing protein n=1 Tax=Mesorhizobium australicum TaxID=536018 RepID=A0A1X7P2F7_9HYPH|nr:hypothetical protein [Mesorhizobium australicum]SMH44323.1 hypothetical protein SAMN02982922_3039 [Mesorhizobium australicum]
MRSIVGRLFFVGAVFCAGATAATAQSNHFRGNACIQTVSAGCAAIGVTVGNCSTARYRPANYNGQGNSSRLSLFNPYYAQNFTLPTGSLVGATLKNVNVTQVGQSATLYTAKARIPAQVPASPVAATIYLNATIDINGFDSDAPTCNVRMRFQGQRFPL